MAKKNAGAQPLADVSMSTMIRTRMTDGRLLGADGAMYLVRRVPLEPVKDAKTIDQRMQAFVPLMAAYDEMAALTPATVNRRAMARSNYRDVQALLINLPQKFIPQGSDGLTEYLKKGFPDAQIMRRILLFVVKLKAKTGGGGGLKSTINSVAETLAHGGTPMSDYDDDYRRVDDALARCGFSKPTSKEIALANSWWNIGRFPDTVELAHSDHLHIFQDSRAVRMAKAADQDDCSSWPRIPGQHSITFAALEGFDFDFLQATEEAANWAENIVSVPALAISIRGKIEPAGITRAELRRQRKRYLDDIRERAKHGKMERAEQEEMESTLAEVEGVYGSRGGTPTLVDASVLVAFDGQIDDVSQVPSMANLRVMDFRQRQALAEMMMCSPVIANPHLHDLPSQTIAASGIQSLSVVGDKDGALLGYTERDSQPAYMSASAAYQDDLPPIFVGVGQTGSGKSMLMLWLTAQWAASGQNQILVDPKTGSDHSATILNASGQVSSLDELSKSDGVFDPIRFSHRKETGIELAVSMLANIDPWGTGRKYEQELMVALNYGMDLGADCTGAALEFARRDGKVSSEIVDPILNLSKVSPLFNACVGRTPGTEGLRVFNGTTLIKVGSVHLDLPDPGNIAGASLIQRINLSLVRMMVFGSAMALEGRGGVIHLDEAWVFLGAGRSEIERLGRVARSQKIQVCLYTQRISDALNAKLDGYISRGIILPIEDQAEARAACQLFKIEPTPERMARITAKATMSSGEGVAPNAASMRALRDPRTKQVIRGTIGIYVDLSGRAVPTEIKLPDNFLADASTNPDDIQSKLEAQARRAA